MRALQRVAFSVATAACSKHRRDKRLSSADSSFHHVGGAGVSDHGGRTISERWFDDARICEEETMLAKNNNTLHLAKSTVY